MSANVSLHGVDSTNTLTNGKEKWVPIKETNNSLHVTVVPTAANASAVDQRLARFDAVADMPADITSGANVTADVVKMTTFTSTARTIKLVWHGAGIAGPTTTATEAFGPVAIGARITINAADDATAATKLTYTDLTGGGTSASGTADTFMVSNTFPEREIVVSTAITRIDAIGIPNGLSTQFDVILPCFLEILILG